MVTMKNQKVEVRNYENVLGEIITSSDDFKKNGSNKSESKSEIVHKTQSNGSNETKKLEKSITPEIKSLNVKATDLASHLFTLHSIQPVILNYVSLCSQDDSLWPMTHLKQRLDEIFSITCFNKVIDMIKNKKKEIINLIKLKKHDIEAKEREFIIFNKTYENIMNDHSKYDQMIESINIDKIKFNKLVEEITNLKNKIETLTDLQIDQNLVKLKEYESKMGCTCSVRIVFDAHVAENLYENTENQHSENLYKRN
ncbi:putative DNA repair protein, partial [Pseudoloma neurophilia]